MDFLRIAVLNYKQLHLSEEGSGYMHMYVLKTTVFFTFSSIVSDIITVFPSCSNLHFKARAISMKLPYVFGHIKDNNHILYSNKLPLILNYFYIDLHPDV